MRKIFIQFSLLVVLIIIASCSNENIIDAERNAIKQVDPKRYLKKKLFLL